MNLSLDYFQGWRKTTGRRCIY